MHGFTFDLTVNIPMLCGGSIFLITLGSKLGKISAELERIGKVADELPDLDSRVAHIEGHLGLKK